MSGSGTAHRRARPDLPRAAPTARSRGWRSDDDRSSRTSPRL